MKFLHLKESCELKKFFISLLDPHLSKKDSAYEQFITFFKTAKTIWPIRVNTGEY